MNEDTDQKKELGSKQKNTRWRFWFLVSFSLLLIVTFVYYLPLRFEHQVFTSGEEMHEEMEEMHSEVVHGEARYHEENEIREGLSVNLNVTPVPLRVNVATRLDFFVNEKPGNIPVPASELEVAHTKLIHVIGVRNDLSEFFHIHPIPTITPGIFSTFHVFGKPGVYKIWSEVKKDGINHIVGHTEVDVEGEGPREEKEISFARNVIVDRYQVALQVNEPVVKDHEHDLSFDIHTLTGEEVAVEDYLGAAMHLSIIKDDLREFIHTHPEGVDHHGSMSFFNEAYANGVHQDTGEGELINFHVAFPEAGFYKAFAQFRPQGINLPPDEALTASFWIEVKEREPFGISAWWGLLIVSLVLIVGLSLGVRRYLQVKA